MKINVIDDKGIEKNANIITSFRFNKKKYVIYTFNEEDDTNSVRIYISELRIKSEHFSFNNIINSEEWDYLKELMREMAKGIDNVDFVLENYDVEVINLDDILIKYEYTLATIKDSKIVKVSPKFIGGLYNTYKELFSRLNNSINTIEEPKVPRLKIEEKDLPAVVDNPKSSLVESSDDNDQDQGSSQKMKDIWEYSSMLQKKIARDMESLNSKVVKLDGERYYVKVKDPLYFKEKLDIKGDISSSMNHSEDDYDEIINTNTMNISDNVLKELEPVNVLGNIGINDNQSLFNKLEKELSGINDNFNKIVVKNQEKKVKIANEIEKRLQDVVAKERELEQLERRLMARKEKLDKKEEELLLANARLEENVKALTKYANMVNSVILKRSYDD